MPSKNKTRGKIIVRADSVAQSNNEVVMGMSARLATRSGFCCNSDNPYVLISRARSANVGDNDSDFIRVFQSSSVPQTHTPIWTPQKIKMQVLCNSDYDLPIKIGVY